MCVCGFYTTTNLMGKNPCRKLTAIDSWICDSRKDIKPIHAFLVCISYAYAYVLVHCLFVECGASVVVVFWMACHMATGFRSDDSIWIQCLDPLSDVWQPTITWPMGFALLIVQLVSVGMHVSGEQPTTVMRICIELSIYGGTLNIIASLKIGQLSARFMLVFFFDTFLSFFCR